jgi:uncharacterized protein YyaL (SSP411 family)
MKNSEFAIRTSKFFILLLLIAASLAAAPNRLAKAKSPYLRQHANNPVDWYPWSTEALSKAKRENKPIFLSIGYSSCHWCHVMERESFADNDVARALAPFVAIKVDREERPDIDAAYTAAALQLLDEVGWPLNVFLTPDGKPFFAATYLPKDELIGIAGKLAKTWREQPAQITTMARTIVDDLRKPPVIDAEALGFNELEKGYLGLAASFDAEHGGFGVGRKMPSATSLMFLLRHWKRMVTDPRPLAMVEKTLQAMRNSPLFDAKNGGFHRYATDREWQHPHTEKMLYDQALLAITYLEAYQATRKPEYADTARRVLAYVLRDLRAPNGAFYSAKDADSDARDEKILSDWNGLMIAALSTAAVVLDDSSYAASAARAAKAISEVRPFLDDYAFMIWGLLNLYEADGDIRWLKRAIALQDKSLVLFRGGYLSATDDLFIRYRTVRDSATPAGNAVQLMNLLRLSRMTARDDYAAAARDLMRRSAGDVRGGGAFAFLSAVDFALGPSFEIVLAGDDVAPLKRAVFGSFVPNKVVLYRTPALPAIAPFTKTQTARRGKATAYVCRNFVCNLPTGDARKVAELLR